MQRTGFDSPVDIVVPFHGQYDQVVKLLESIFRYTRSSPYRIYLVDDCSPNQSFLDSLSRVEVLHCSRTPEQLGFGGAMKFGFEQTKNPWVVFMNSDCRVEDVGWLRSVGGTMQRLKDQKVRMVAPRTNSPGAGDPRQQGAKGSFAEDVILEDTHLSMYCFMCHRELFQHVGGFIKSYPYGWYEDEEFAYRMRKYGFRQAISGQGWVFHEGGATVRELWRDHPQTRKIMTEDNRQRCIDDIKAVH